MKKAAEPRYNPSSAVPSLEFLAQLIKQFFRFCFCHDDNTCSGNFICDIVKRNNVNQVSIVADVTIHTVEDIFAHSSILCIQNTYFSFFFRIVRQQHQFSIGPDFSAFDCPNQGLDVLTTYLDSLLFAICQFLNSCSHCRLPTFLNYLEGSVSILISTLCLQKGNKCKGIKTFHTIIIAFYVNFSKFLPFIFFVIIIFYIYLL